MYLVEIFLPTIDNTGRTFPQASFDVIRTELTQRFGGVTALMRSPALGLWKDESGAVRRDELVTLEVMTEHLDHAWWQAYREQLENRFRQDEIVVRATAFDRL